MINTMLKSTFKFKQNLSSYLLYRDYRNLTFDKFKVDLENALKSKKKKNKVGERE